MTEQVQQIFEESGPPQPGVVTSNPDATATTTPAGQEQLYQEVQGEYSGGGDWSQYYASYGGYPAPPSYGAYPPPFGYPPALYPGYPSYPGYPPPPLPRPGYPPRPMTSTPARPVPPQNSGTPSQTIWLGGVPPDCTSEELRQLCEPYGTVEDIRILREKQCAFVRYSDMASSERAHRELVNATIRGVRLRIGWGRVDRRDQEAQQREGSVAQRPEGSRYPGDGRGGAVTIPPANSNANTGSGGGGGGSNSGNATAGGGTSYTGPGSQVPTRSLWIGNLDRSVSEQDLREVFSPFGTLERIKIISEKNCAFVDFETLESALAAKRSCQGKLLKGREMRINFGKGVGGKALLSGGESAGKLLCRHSLLSFSFFLRSDSDTTTCVVTVASTDYSATTCTTHTQRSRTKACH
jgi:RNA recognition motif-containing protein